MKKRWARLLLLVLLCGLVLFATGCSARRDTMLAKLEAAGYTVTALSAEEAEGEAALTALIQADTQKKALSEATVYAAEKDGARSLFLVFPSPSAAFSFLSYEETEGEKEGTVNLDAYGEALASGRLDDRYLLVGEDKDVFHAFLYSEPIIQRGLVRITTDGESLPVGLIYLVFFLTLLLPYAIGNFNMPCFVCRRMHGEDLALIVPDAPPSVASAQKIYGKRTAVLVAIGEGGVMVFTLLLAFLLLGADYNSYGFVQNSMIYVAGAGCLLGQTLPLKKSYRGEKGMVSLAVMMAMLSPTTFLLCAVFFLLLLLLTRYVSLAVITTSLLYPLLLNRSLAFFGYGADGVITMVPILLGLLMLYTNRGAILRIKERTEPRFSFRKSK